MYACEGGRDGRVVDGGGLENTSATRLSPNDFDGLDAHCHQNCHQPPSRPILWSMQAFLRPVMWLAVAGFFASLLVHLLALIGLPSPFGSATWLLHIGIFVVWLPTVLVAQRLGKGAK